MVTNDVIFLASGMENDDGDATAIRTVVKSAAIASLAGSASASRASRVRALIRDINGAMAVPSGAPNFDDKLQTVEVRFSARDLLIGGTNTGPIHRDTDLAGDGGRYKLWFTITGA